jgi:hypothetical protein
MQAWMMVFVIVAAAAIVMQAVIMFGMYSQFKQTSEHLLRMTRDLDSRISPILLRMNRILEDSEERISSIVGDAAEVTRIARGQAQKVDRVFTDAVDRLRVQVIRSDQILTGALEVIEDTGSRVRRTLQGPVMQVSAVLKGIKVGLDFIRGQQPRRPTESASVDDELFI